MPVELFANKASTTVASGKTAVAAGTVEAWTVASSAGFPAASATATPPTAFRIQDPVQTDEIMLVTGVTGETWTVVRGSEGATTAHAPGFTVRPVFSAASVQSLTRSFAEFDIKKDFGAKGDGVTDDGPAIQAMWNAVPAEGAELVARDPTVGPATPGPGGRVPGRQRRGAAGRRQHPGHR